MDKKPSILFTISDTGGGHRSGAAAIDAALEELVGDSVQRHIVDLLASTGTPFIRNAPDLYDQLSTRWLPFYDMLYRVTDGRGRIAALTSVVYLQAHRNVVHVLDQTRPNLIVSVHPLSSRLIGYARRTYRLSFRFACAVTDLVSLHAAWADPEVELCMVPTEEAFDRQLKLGMPPQKLVRTGFPVHPKFTAYTASRETARAALGVAREPFTLLVTSGGVGAGNLREIVQEIHRAFPQLQQLIVTGKNSALRDELQALRLGANIHVYGFVDNMEVLMAASDIIVTKAGPGTLMEALVMRRPVIVTEAVGMQEQGNIDFVLNHELGAFCPTVDRLTPAISELMQPETYQATVARLADAVPRDGAMQIARLLVEQLQLAPPQRRLRLRLPSMTTLQTMSLRRIRQGTGRSRWRLRRFRGAPAGENTTATTVRRRWRRRNRL